MIIICPKFSEAQAAHMSVPMEVDKVGDVLLYQYIASYV